jgi:hypothetical protein
VERERLRGVGGGYGISGSSTTGKHRDLLPDRILGTHPELYIGDPDALPMPAEARSPELKDRQLELYSFSLI